MERIWLEMDRRCAIMEKIIINDRRGGLSRKTILRIVRRERRKKSIEEWGTANEAPRKKET